MLLGDRHDLAPEALHVVAVDAGGARHEPRRVQEVGRAAAVDPHLDVGPAAHERAGRARVVEVDVREQDPLGDLVAEGLQQRAVRGLRAGVDDDPVVREAADRQGQAHVADVDLPRQRHGTDLTIACMEHRLRRAGPPVDDAHVRGPLDGRALQRAVSLEPGQGPDGPVDRLRPADADGLRPRPRARARRGRQGRHPDRPQGRHARAHGRHPARRDEHVDDDQRDRGVAARRSTSSSPRRTASTRRPSRARPRTTSSRSSWRAGPTRSRPAPRCG